MGKILGSDRFEVIRTLGSGGMGVVYEALDRERDERVAVKTLRNLNASLLYRLKKEFRALADLDHPNLVSLYELFSEDGSWFYTMELVEGTTFLKYVRPVDDEVDADAATEGIAWDDDENPTLTGNRSEPIGSPVYDSGRLRKSLGQLAQAVDLLHRSGKVHRDIKPSNVMVTAEGRVVLMDFGIVAEMSQEEIQSTGAGVVGTAAYMAPEQAAGEAVGAAADWYSVGVMLYESMAGILPFSGSMLQVLLEKQQRDPVRPSVYIGAEDPDLESLCVDLLRRQPDARPDARHIARRLGLPLDHIDIPTLDRSGGTAGPTFVGREDELQQLKHAFQGASHGTPAVVLVGGASGIGKTRLVRHFLSEIRKSHDSSQQGPMVLAGRCHRREIVPYKAFDGVVDALSHALIGLPRETLREVLPEDSPLLGRLFPVLKRVPGISGTTRKVAGIQDPQELRARGFLKLRQLLTRLAMRQPLALFIDDLHWADEDSIELFEDLIRPPKPLPAFLVACYRTVHVESNGGLAAMLERHGERAEVQQLELGYLSRDESMTLASQILGEQGHVLFAAERVWGESAGNPFKVGEICRYLMSREQDEATVSGVDFEEALRSRVRKLDPDPRRVLELLAVATGPIPPEVVGRALELSPDERRAAVSALHMKSLIRRHTVRSEACVEIYHDSIRAAALEDLDDEQVRVYHEVLAPALGTWDGVPAESLSQHWRAAGYTRQAVEYARQAARQAQAKLAFEQAANLYRRALELENLTGQTTRGMFRDLGDCLLYAGRNAEAAEAFFCASVGASKEEAHELRRLCAEQLLVAGQYQKGLSSAESVLAEIGIRTPRSRAGALLTMLWTRLLVRLRGLRWTSTDQTEIPAWTLTQFDTLWSIARSLAITRPILSAAFSWLALRHAVRMGEPSRVATTLLGTSVQLALLGNWERADQHLELALVPVHRLEDEKLLGIEAMCKGMVAFHKGSWSDALQLLERAEEILGERCQGAWGQVTMTRQHLLDCLYAMGSLDRLAKRVARHVRDAQLRKDRFTLGSIKSRFSVVWLAADEPDRVLTEQEGLLETWPSDQITPQHGWAVQSQIEAQLYKGQVESARERFEEFVPGMRRYSNLPRIPWARSEWLYLEGRLALAGRGAGRDMDPARIRGLVDKLRREQMPHTQAWALLLEAGLAAATGDRAGAADRLTEAEIRLEACGARLVAAAARRRRAGLVDVIEGDRLRDVADTWMKARGVSNPRRMTQMLLPGFANQREAGA